MHGVNRKIWFGAAKTAARIKDDAMFNKRPTSEDSIDSLGTWKLTDYYAQHLSALLQVKKRKIKFSKGNKVLKSDHYLFNQTSFIV